MLSPQALHYPDTKNVLYTSFMRRVHIFVPEISKRENVHFGSHIYRWSCKRSGILLLRNCKYLIGPSKLIDAKKLKSESRDTPSIFCLC